MKRIFKDFRKSLELGKGTSTSKLTFMLLGGILVLQSLLIWSYVGAFHKPSPLNVPLGLTGQAQIADYTETRLRQAGNQFAVRRFESRQDALDAMKARDIPAFLDVQPQQDTLVVSEADSSVLSAQLPSQFQAMEPKGRVLKVEKQFPLPDSDSRGLVPFYTVVGLIVGGYLAATIIGLTRGDKPSSRRSALKRPLLLAGYSAAAGIAGALITQIVIGVLPVHFVVVAAAGALIVFTSAMVTSGLQSLFGILGTSLAILLLVVLGNPGSGGPALNEMVMPGPWRTVGPYLPTFAGVDLVRGIAYFKSVDIARDILLLIGYIVAGISAMLLFGYKTASRKEHMNVDQSIDT